MLEFYYFHLWSVKSAVCLISWCAMRWSSAFLVFCDMWVSFLIFRHVNTCEPAQLELNCAALLRVSFYGQLVSSQDTGHNCSRRFIFFWSISCQPFLWDKSSNYSLFRAWDFFFLVTIIMSFKCNGYFSFFLLILFAVSPFQWLSGPKLVYSSDENRKHSLLAVWPCLSFDKSHVFDATGND